MATCKAAARSMPCLRIVDAEQTELQPGHKGSQHMEALIRSKSWHPKVSATECANN